MKKLIATAAGLGTTALFASQAFAANFNPCPQPNGTDTSFTSLCNSNTNVILGNVVTVVLIVVVVIALFFLIWGGIKWITSGGDKAKVEVARNTIVGAIIGMIIAFLAFFIINLVGNLFGIKLLGGGSATDQGIPSIFQNSGTGSSSCASITSPGACGTGCRWTGSSCISN